MKIELAFTDEIKNMPIEVLELSNRSQNCMTRSKITTIGELLKYTDNLECIRGMGYTSSNEVKNKLINLVLANSDETVVKNFWYAMLQENSNEELTPVVRKYEEYLAS